MVSFLSHHKRKRCKMAKILRRCRGNPRTHKYVVILDSYTGSLEDYSFTDTLCDACRADLEAQLAARRQAKNEEKKDEKS